MNILALERGERPTVRTKARVVAPQAVTFLGKLLEDEFFADQALLVLDWKGDLSWSGEGEMPEELRVPILWVECTKWYPEYQQTLRVDYKLDLEETFGQDQASSDDLYEIVEGLREQIHQQESRRKT